MTEDDRTVLSFFILSGDSQEAEEVTAAEDIIGEDNRAGEMGGDIAMDDRDEDLAAASEVDSDEDHDEDSDEDRDEDSDEDSDEESDVEYLITDTEDEGGMDGEEKD